MTFDLPEGWSLLTVSQLAGLGGVVADGDWIESKDQDPDGDVRLIQLADIGVGEFLDRSSRFLTSKKARELQCTMLQSGDLLIARMPDPLGRACLFPGVGQPSVTAVDVFIWRPGKNGAVTRWLMHAVNSPQVRAHLQNIAGGTTRQRVSGGNLKRLALPTPPEAMQHRLATTIDGLLARSKSARVELDHVPKLVARYKQAVLMAAFRGDLTANWRITNASVGPNLLITERDAKNVRKRAGGGTVAASSDGSPIPRAWRVAPIELIGEVILGRQRSPENHIGPNMRPYVRAANITWDGWDLSDVKQMNFDRRDFERFRLQTGDVLINEGSGSAAEVGKPAIWKGEIEDCCFQNTLIAVRPRATTPEYLYFVLFNAAVSRAFVDETRGVNIHHIGRAGLAQFAVPVPPIEEQQEMVCHIKTAFTVIEKLVAETGRATSLLERLDQAVLAKAFNGDLIAPNVRAVTQATMAAE